ncbi:MAG: DNA polymerase III subunit delta' C-terminal domain-containing protein, partial [Candidatus Omnitrophota bacterium]|nr:DNA polymerase III subunit delta' C-terminal domain-containing protein [Candidatus Omnitrophota bacterium]
EVKEILIKVHKMDDSKAHILSRLSSGSLGEALKFKEDAFFDKRSGLIDGLLKRTFFNSDFEAVSKEDLKLYLGLMLSWYRDVLITKAGMEDSMLVNLDKKDAISGEAKRMNMDYLDNVIKEIIQTNSYLDQNANSKLAMGVLGSKIQ